VCAGKENFTGLSAQASVPKPQRIHKREALVELGIAKCRIWHRWMERFESYSANTSFRVGPDGRWSVRRGQRIAEWCGCPSRFNSPRLALEARRKHVTESVKQEFIGLRGRDLTVRQDELHLFKAPDASVHRRDIQAHRVCDALEGARGSGIKKPDEDEDVLAPKHGQIVAAFSFCEK
jgi:hypothetical protein